MQTPSIDPWQLEVMPILDDAAIAMLRDPVGGDPDFLVEVVDAFLSDTPPRIESLQGYWRAATLRGWCGRRTA